MPGPEQTENDAYRIRRIEPNTQRPNTVDADALLRWVEGNTTDLGELGQYIRVQYVRNGIQLLLDGVLASTTGALAGPIRARMIEAVGHAMHGEAWTMWQSFAEEDWLAVVTLADGVLAWLKAHP